jgi:hypothetical protein
MCIQGLGHFSPRDLLLSDTLGCKVRTEIYF